MLKKSVIAIFNRLFEGAADQFRFYFMITAVVSVLFVTGLSSAFGENKQIFRIGTGGSAGVYYPIGKLIARGLTDIRGQTEPSGEIFFGVPGMIAVAQFTAGSVENVKALSVGEIEAGLIQADVASSAYKAAGRFSGQSALKKLRAVASLYPEKFHIVVRKDAGITSINDLEGKRISLDEAGSGTLSVMRIILAAHDMSEDRMDAVYLKPVFTLNRMTSGDIQGFAMMSGTPMAAVLDISRIGIRLVPIKEEIALAINSRHPYLVPGVIGENVYPGVDRTPTLQVYALFLVSADLDTGLVYRVTRSLWSGQMQNLLSKGHPRGKSIRLGTALNGLSVPLHTGAEKFYREQGLVKE